MTEEELWASVGADNKNDFLAFWDAVLDPVDITSYLDLAVALGGASWYLSEGGAPLAEEPDYVDICDANPPKKDPPIVTINDVTIPDIVGCVPTEATIDSITYTYPDEIIELPPSSFLMQDGSIEPIYPTFEGAFVYDLQYKKWGKFGEQHKLLMNYSPINTHAGDKPIPVDIFSVNAGCLKDDGTIVLFDKFPQNSLLKMGKIGYYRQGFTDAETVDIQFREPATGTMLIEGSLDGKSIESATMQASSFENVTAHRSPFNNSAKWFNISITGIYDIKNIDFTGHKKGKR